MNKYQVKCKFTHKNLGKPKSLMAAVKFQDKKDLEYGAICTYRVLVKGENDGH